MGKKTQPRTAYGERKQGDHTDFMDQNFSFSPRLKQRAGIRCQLFISDSCYLGALVGRTSVFGSHEHLQGNQMKNLVQNRHVHETSFYLSCLQYKPENKRKSEEKNVII